MEDQRSFRKYQVYFFLDSSATMEVGDRRLFYVSVQGMGPDDELTRPPEVLVFRGADTLQRLKPMVDVRQVETAHRNGERRFAFEWTAPAPGRYRFIGNSANNRFDEGPGGRVKLASMEFPRRIIEAFVPNYREIFRRHEVLRSELSVDVIAAGDQLLLNGGEYPVNQEFRFDAYVCGNCIAQNRRAPGRIWVDAESESGRDLLDDYVFVPISDAGGRTVGMRLKFYLGGRVSRDGEEVLLTLHADDAVRRIPVVIYPE